MSRVQLTDGSGWFDDDKATEFDEATWFDGSNRISKATGSQWDHETLYLTAGGAWVLSTWSQRDGCCGTNELIDLRDAVAWLIQNEQAGDLSPAVLALIAEELAATEV